MRIMLRRLGLYRHRFIVYVVGVFDGSPRGISAICGHVAMWP
jgi:hypothetical protein